MKILIIIIPLYYIHYSVWRSIGIGDRDGFNFHRGSGCKKCYRYRASGQSNRASCRTNLIGHRDDLFGFDINVRLEECLIPRLLVTCKSNVGGTMQKMCHDLCKLRQNCKIKVPIEMHK